MATCAGCRLMYSILKLLKQQKQKRCVYFGMDYVCTVWFVIIAVHRCRCGDCSVITLRIKSMILTSVPC